MSCKLYEDKQYSIRSTIRLSMLIERIWFGVQFPAMANPNTVPFHYCRDIFLRRYKRRRSLFYVKVDDDLVRKQIVKYIRSLETILKIKDRSKFYKCGIYYYEHGGILHHELTGHAEVQMERIDYFGLGIKPSSFWRESYLKISFLTGVMKAVSNTGRLLGADSFANSSIKKIGDDLIRSNVDYFCTTEMATRKFLSGYTNLASSIDGVLDAYGVVGWQGTFSDNRNLDKLHKIE